MGLASSTTWRWGQARVFVGWSVVQAQLCYKTCIQPHLGFIWFPDAVCAVCGPNAQASPVRRQSLSQLQTPASLCRCCWLPQGAPVLPSSTLTVQTLNMCNRLPACVRLQVLLAAQSASRSRLPRAASVPVDRARAASPGTAAARGVYPQLSSHGRKLEKMSNLVRLQL